MLLARIYEVFPLRCTHCGDDMRIIAFITDGPAVRDVLAHLGEPTATRRSPSHGKQRRRGDAQTSHLPVRSVAPARDNLTHWRFAEFYRGVGFPIRNSLPSQRLKSR